ncbi:MAG: SLC13 family permease [Kordiimonas sp.]|nr:SLC13 family permease [Kordiimonas sp.]|tara:strand:- start:3303 stop:5132 length:1830 start_codon:yes stop_codon:yes gene_type:complete
MWATLLLVVGAIFFYAMERVALEITSLGVIAICLLLFHFFPVLSAEGHNLLDAKTLLSGFADPALISILALLVIGQGMVQTGALETPARWLVKTGVSYPKRTILLCMITVMVISAFLNNTPVVVIFIPIISTLADKLGTSAARLLMPLSFVAILGGMTTLIGSSTNLLVSGSLQGLTGESIGFFDFSFPGLVLATLGFFYVAFIAPRLLPEQAKSTETQAGASGKQFIFQMDILPGNSLYGKKSVAGMFPNLTGVTVRMIQRGQETFLPPFDDLTLTTGDAVLLATTRRALNEILVKDPHFLSGIINEETINQDGEPVQNEPEHKALLAEVVVAPASRLDGRTLDQVGYHLQGGCKILGVQRRSRMFRTAMSDIRLEAGDVLLVVGNKYQIRTLRTNRDVLLMEWSTTIVPSPGKTRTALATFLGVVGLAATGIVPIPIAALAGAAIMVMTDCLNIRQASRAVDRRVFLLVGAALAMGTSLQATGGAAFLAHAMVEALSAAPIPLILSGFFLLIAVLTNVLSNNATAVLFTPIALNLAAELGVDPLIFVYAVIFAANCSFATPMGYQTNLLVMGPGNYKFKDFLKVGGPLIILIWLAYSIFAPWYYGLW